MISIYFSMEAVVYLKKIKTKASVLLLFILERIKRKLHITNSQEWVVVLSTVEILLAM